MTKKQIARLIREQRPEPPEGYGAMIERTLDGLMKGKGNMKRRYKVSTMLLAAALIVIALAGAALAASELKLFSKDRFVAPLDGAEDMVQTGLGRAENDYAVVTVEEAVYDGHDVRALLRVTPKDIEHYALYEPVNVRSYDEYIVEDAKGYIDVTGRKDGRTILWYHPDMVAADQPAGDLYSETQEDGSELVWLEVHFDTDQGDAVSCAADVVMRLQTASGYERLDDLIIPFELTREKEERHYEIIPVEGSAVERFSIVRGAVTFTKLVGYITVDYAYEEGPGEEMGVDLRFYDADGERINNRSGSSCFDLGGDVFRSTFEIQSFDDAPQTVFIEPKVIGEDRTLGRVECRLVETDFIDLPESPEPETPHLTYLTPKGSWVSDHMRLLFVEVHETTGLVVITFTCDSAETAGKIRFTLLDVDGQSMELKNMLDEEGNPKGQQQFDDSCEGFFRAMMAVRDSSALSSGQIAIEVRMEGEATTLARFEGVVVVTSASSAIGDLSQGVLVALPVNPNLVFTASDDTCYHTRPNCGRFGISYTPMGITLTEAVDMGKTACPDCCEGAE